LYIHIVVMFGAVLSLFTGAPAAVTPLQPPVAPSSAQKQQASQQQDDLVERLVADSSAAPATPKKSPTISTTSSLPEEEASPRNHVRSPVKPCRIHRSTTHSHHSFSPESTAGNR
jgi:hypothetical protein